MDASNNWTRATHAVQFLNAVQDRGGNQGKDPKYNPRTRVPQPARPSPSQHRYQQQPQPYGQASSYYNEYPHSPFPPASNPYPESCLPPAQGYPPLHPLYGPDQNQAQGPHFAGQFLYQEPTFGVAYSSAPGAPTSDPPTSDPYSGQQTGYNHITAPAPQAPAFPFGSQQAAPQPQYDNSHGAMQRSYTEPTQDHVCSQHWNYILDICEICKPIGSVQRAQTTWTEYGGGFDGGSGFG